MNVRVKEFNVGDEAFIPCKRRGKYSKLEKFYSGQFIILEQSGPLNHRVRKKPRGKISVTNVDKLSPVAVLRIAKKMTSRRGSRVNRHF